MDKTPSCDDAPIAALSTPYGRGAVAIVRGSGRNCHQLLLPLLETADAKKFKIPPYKELRLCRLISPGTQSEQRVIDEPLVVFFKGPNSYTGQDSFELHLHGGPYITKAALELLWKNGFSPAEAGAFTRRAFLNGKIDLTTAEGIRALASAESEQQWIAARSLASGKLSDSIDSMRSKLIEASAYLEAQIDFPDEGDTSSIHREQILGLTKEVYASLEKLEKSFAGGKVASHGLKVALVGKPNAGKSTLMNTLLGENRAIVSKTAGTTRDYLSEKCIIQGRLIELIDTAGIRDEHSHAPQDIDEVERIGIKRSIEIASSSDLILLLSEKDGEKDEDPFAELLGGEKTIEKPVLRIRTKIDIEDDSREPAGAARFDGWDMKISCKTLKGTEELEKLLASKVDELVASVKSDVFITEPRHQAAIVQAKTAVENFFVQSQRGAYEEMLAFELGEAKSALESIVGEISPDDVLGAIFSTFCVGK